MSTKKDRGTITNAENPITEPEKAESPDQAPPRAVTGEHQPQGSSVTPINQDQSMEMLCGSSYRLREALPVGVWDLLGDVGEEHLGIVQDLVEGP